MTNAKNKRLSDGNRDRLINFARKEVERTQDSAAIDAAYELAADAVAAAVERAFPAKDMKVLAKYELARPDACIYVSGGYGEFMEFTFRDDDKRTPSRPSRNCRRQPVLLEDAERELITSYFNLLNERKETVRRRLNDFITLIRNSTNFNGLVEIWPAAEALRGEIVGHGTAVSLMSDDVIARLKADPALVPA